VKALCFFLQLHGLSLGLIQWSTIQIPAAIGTSSSTVVSVITKWQGPAGVYDHRCAPSAAALSVSLTLRASFCFREVHATHMDGLGRSWLDLPSVTATTTPVIDIITEMTGPRRGWAPTGTRASCSLALRAALCLLKAKTILHVWYDLSMCLYSPLVTAASRTLFGVISKRLGPSRAGTPSAASERWTKALGTVFSFFETNPESSLSPAFR